MPIKLKERDIARTCGDLLALDGWRLIWCEPVSRREWGRGFGEKGMPDLLAIRYLNDGNPNVPVWGTNRKMYDPIGQVMWIEWKSATGKAAPHQNLWHAAERARGALTLIAGEGFPGSIEGFKEWYRASGLNRGRV